MINPPTSGSPPRGNNRLLENSNRLLETMVAAVQRMEQRLAALEAQGLPLSAAAGDTPRGSPDARPARSRSRTTRTTVTPSAGQTAAWQGAAQDVLAANNYKAIKQLTDMVAELR